MCVMHGCYLPQLVIYNFKGFFYSYILFLNHKRVPIVLFFVGLKDDVKAKHDLHVYELCGNDTFCSIPFYHKFESGQSKDDFHCNPRRKL
jgi:hypothetical protein